MGDDVDFIAHTHSHILYIFWVHTKKIILKCTHKDTFFAEIIYMKLSMIIIFLIGHLKLTENDWPLEIFHI